MHKKLLYITIILAMLFGMFGLMGPGGVQQAQAADMAGLGQGTLVAATATPYDLVANGPGSDMAIDWSAWPPPPRLDTDPTDCDAGNLTAWWYVNTGTVGVAAAPRFLNVGIRTDLDAVAIVTNAAGTVVLGCMNVRAGNADILTVPITAGTDYAVMVAEKQGYPVVAGEELDVHIMQSRHNNVAMVHDLDALLGPGAYEVGLQTQDGLGKGFVAQYSSLFDFGPPGTMHFFDFVPGPTHFSYSRQNRTLFRTFVEPTLIVIEPTVMADQLVQATTGATNPTELIAAPSAWQVADPSVDFVYQLGIPLRRASIPAGEGVSYNFFLEEGRYDFHLESDAPLADPYYLLSIFNRYVGPPFVSTNLDFQAGGLPQATIQLNTTLNPAEIVRTDLAVRISPTLGDRLVDRIDGEQLIVNSGLATEIEVRMLDSDNWIYAVDPIFFAGLEAPAAAITRTFGPNEEANITLDDNSAGDGPYDFYTSIAFSADLSEVTTTDYFDIMGNQLIGVFAPNNTLLPLNPADATRDRILPNTWIAYGQVGGLLATEFTWDNGPWAVPDEGIGRYYAQRSLLTSEDVRAGGAVADVYNYDDTGFDERVSGVAAIGAFSPPDVPLMGHWSWSWVMAMYEEGYTTGFEDGTFGPDLVMTRAEMAVFLTRVLADISTLDAPGAGVGGVFTDVPADYWAAGAIEMLADLGITSGYGDGTFGPDDAVTRAEMSKFIQLTGRAAVLFGGVVNFDVDINVLAPGNIFVDVPAEHWALLWIEEMVVDGLTSGCRVEGFDWYFCPEDSVTRGQMAKFIMTMLQPDAVTQGFWPILSPER